ncbi:14163_t:CDS:2, partial [Racocetra fulgida]
DYPDIPFYDVVEDPEGKEIAGGLFNEPDIDIDFEVFSKEMLPNFQFHKKMKMSEDNAVKGRKLLKTRTLSKLGGIAYESNARRNLGGGKTYQKNEFRSIHNNRKANTSRPPSVHVDDFMSGKIPANQQHPDMMTPTSAATTSYIEFERRMDGQRDYTRYDNQTMRTGYYDSQYYGIPSPMTPYDRPPVPQSAPGIGPRIKGGGENRGRTIPQEWPPRSVTSQPARRPERPF